jgi:hypothetical protein
LLLGAHIHLITIFLVDEGDRDIFRFGDAAVFREDPFAMVAKDDVPDVDLLGSAGHPSGAVLARLHCKEEGDNGNGRGYGWGRIAGRTGIGTRHSVERS